LGSISNIYVNINYLYSQAISKNVASNDNQNTNNISIREYLQGILRDIQNSLGNINQFDIQVDERTAIGRIIDLNFTGDPTLELFKLEIHNTNSVVRKYGFQSKIFPEMGSIIAISAQDPSGIGKLGYDNATLVAWNEGIRDRLIPKKTFTNDILLKGADSTAFILPFLTKINDYFQAIKGQDTDNVNFLFGGLDFAYRDFLANLNRFDARNNFKTIIPTSLDITLDGIGGMVIGNLFTINQDIVPKGYRNVKDRKLAYIVTKLGHSISDNDWITELSAYPVIFETATGTNVASEWTGQRYLNSTEITVGGVKIAKIPELDVKNIPKNSTIPVVQYLKGKKYSNGQLPDNELRYLKIPDDPSSNKLHRLVPIVATQWEKLIAKARQDGYTVEKLNISYQVGAAYRKIGRQKTGEGRATPGTSPHGWGIAGNNLSLRFTVSKVPYVGFYNIINNNKYFTGKVYDTNSKSLEKYNIIQTASSVIASRGSIPTLAGSLSSEITSDPSIRYFYKELNQSSIKIKEINKSSYNQLSTVDNMNYQVISFNSSTQTLEEVNKQMPGLLTFLTT
jgi:hypothetical protein